MKNGWTFKTIEECFPYIKNGANIKQEKGATGYPITRIETLSGGVFNRDRLGYANITDISKYQEYVLNDDDILMSHINSKVYIGRTIVYRRCGVESVIHGMNLLRLKPNLKLINSSLFKYYTLSAKFKEDIARIRKDAVNQSSMAISDLKKIKIPVPPMPEQERIVAELDLLNGVLEKQKAQLKELDTLAQSIFYDMFGDPIENPKGWDVKNLGNELNVFGGYAFKSDRFVSAGIPVLRIGNINSGKVKINQVVFYEEDPKLDRYMVYPGDLVISLTGTAGKDDYGNICKLDDSYNRYYLNQRNAKLELGKNLCSSFVQYYLKDGAIKGLLTAVNRGVRQGNISNKDIENLQIPVPPLSLQQAFADKIASIEKQKAAITQSMAETQKLLDYTMDKYFG